MPPQPVALEREHGARAAAVFAIMLSGVVVLPAVRPLLAARGAGESSMHAFASAGMLGAVAFSTWLVRRCDRAPSPLRRAAIYAGLDASLAVFALVPLPVPVLLLLRFAQGALNVAALSVAMAVAPSPHGGRSGLAAVGSAMMLALVAGNPLAGVALTFGYGGPFVLAGSAAAVAAVLLAGAGTATPRSSPTPDDPSGSTSVRLAQVIAFAERFSVGCFVVTFAVHARERLGLDDRAVAFAYATMLVPFALAMYPVTRAARIGSRGLLLGLGSAVYALAFMILALADRTSVAFAALGVAGVASAFLYAPAMCLASAGAARSTGMARFHAAGCLGMALGPAFAGIVSASLRAAGAGSFLRHALVLTIAGLSTLVAFTAIRPRLRALACSHTITARPERSHS